MSKIIKLIPLLFSIILFSACAGTSQNEIPAISNSPSKTPVPQVSTTLPSLPTSAPTNTLHPQQHSDLIYPPTLNEALPKDNLILASHVYGSKICFDIGIYKDDTYMIISCLGNFTYPSPIGMLNANQSAYIHRWMERFAGFEEFSMHDLLKFLGNGDVIPDYAEKLSMKAMLYDIEWIAHGYIHKGGLPSAVNISLLVLSNQLGIPLDHNNISYFEVVDFPDVCLSAPEPDEVCAQVVTQGFYIQLIAQDMLYEFHTDAFGYDIRQFDEPQIAPTQGLGG